MDHRLQQSRDLVIVMRPWSARAGRIVQPGESRFPVAAAPWLTVGALTPRLRAMALFASPSTDRRTVWARDGLTRLLQLAKLRLAATIEDLDFQTARGLDRSVLLRLAGCDWIRLVPRVGRETIRVLLRSHDLKPWRDKNVVHR